MMHTMLSARRVLWLVLIAIVLAGAVGRAQEASIEKRLEGFDAYMAQVLKDWNVPGIGVGIVVKDKLVFAKGYGYRDYGKKLPFTPATTAPIASNTKLFTAVAAGLLVDEGKLDWDKPIRQYVPGIKFHDDDLDRTVTVRDMLAHRTGITRHDLHLVQVGLHAEGSVRAPEVPRALRSRRARCSSTTT